MTWNSLQNITPEQSENKKFQNYLEQIQDPFKAMALWEKVLWEKANTFWKLFVLPHKKLFLNEHFHTELHQLYKVKN